MNVRSVLTLLAVQLLIVVFWGGKVVQVLWNWFVAPLGVVPLSFWHAVGICALVSVMTLRSSDGTQRSDDDGTYQISAGLFVSTVGPALALAIGYLAKSLG